MHPPRLREALMTLDEFKRQHQEFYKKVEQLQITIANSCEELGLERRDVLGAMGVVDVGGKKFLSHGLSFTVVDDKAITDQSHKWSDMG
jgi:hypothetical protein